MSAILALMATAVAQQAPSQSMNPNISVITDVALAAFSDTPDQRGAHDPQKNGFNLQQVELAIGSAVDPYFRLDGNIVFAQFGVEIEEMYATSLALPLRSQLRVGQFLTRFGRVNATHPHTWDFVDQPLLVGRNFGGEGNRGLGIEGSVLLPTPWFVELAVSETMADGAATARSFYGAEDLGVYSPLDLQTTALLEQFFELSDNWSLLWGLSFAGGPNPSGRRNRSELYGTDVFLNYRVITDGSWQELSLTTEWLHRRRQVPDDVLLDITGLTMATWRFSRRWAVGARYELGTPATGLGGVAVVDPLDAEWDVRRHRSALALTFWPTEFSRLRLQGAADTSEGEGTTFAAFTAFEFNVGAHGAHDF